MTNALKISLIPIAIHEIERSYADSDNAPAWTRLVVDVTFDGNNYSNGIVELKASKKITQYIETQLKNLKDKNSNHVLNMFLIGQWLGPNDPYTLAKSIVNGITVDKTGQPSSNHDELLYFNGELIAEVLRKDPNINVNVLNNLAILANNINTPKEFADYLIDHDDLDTSYVSRKLKKEFENIKNRFITAYHKNGFDAEPIVDCNMQTLRATDNLTILQQQNRDVVNHYKMIIKLILTILLGQQTWISDQQLTEAVRLYCSHDLHGEQHVLSRIMLNELRGNILFNSALSYNATLFGKAIKALTDGGKITLLKNDNEQFLRVTFKTLFKMETDLNNFVNDRLRKPDNDQDVEIDGQGNFILKFASQLQPDDNQLTAVKNAITKHLSILTGGPGTGKTQTVNFIVNELIARGLKDNIVLLAPTGAAATRLTKLANQDNQADLEASTLHSFMRISIDDRPSRLTNYVKDTFQTYYDSVIDNDKPLYVIVDEAGMCDTKVMWALLRDLRLKHHLILVGDADQLPPIKNGMPFDDFIINKNIPTIELHHIYRSLGSIADNTELIRDSNTLDGFQAETIKPLAIKNIDLIEKYSQTHTIYDATDPALAIVHLCDIVKQLTAKPDFNWPQLLIITPFNNGINGTKALNNRINELIDLPQTANRISIKSQGAAGVTTFDEGNYVVNNRNTRYCVISEDDLESLKNSPKPKQEKDLTHIYKATVSPNNGKHTLPNRMCINGDRGFIRKIINVPKSKENKASKLVLIETEALQLENSNPASATKYYLITNEAVFKYNFSLGYVVTVHKAQGNEAKRVILIGTQKQVSQNWTGIFNHASLYTAYTRSKLFCYMIGSPTLFNEAISIPTIRKTNLLDLLADNQTLNVIV